MLNIRKRKRLRFIIIFVSIFIILLLLFAIFGFTESKIHRKDTSKLDIPYNTALYISAKSLDDIYKKIIISTYAYRISYDKQMFEYAVMLKSSEIFIEKAKSINAPLGIVTKYILSRQCAFALYEKKIDDIYSAEYSFIFDIGRVPSLILETFISKDKTDYASEENGQYIKNDEEYKDIAIKVIKLTKDLPEMYFTIHKGLLVFSSTKEKAKNIIDFLYSEKNKADNIKQYNAKFEPDISFYINTEKLENTVKKGINTKNISDIYGYIKLKKEYSKLDIYLTYKNETNKMYEIYKSTTEGTIPEYIPQNTPLYISLDASPYALYTNILEANSSILNPIKQNIIKLNSNYDIQNLINTIDNQMSFFYIKDKEESIPVIALNIKNEAVAIPMLEQTLSENFSEIKKESSLYHKYYIYTYSMKNSKPLYYTSINGVFFFSNYETPIKTIIDENIKGKSLAKIFAKNKINTKNANYILYLDFKSSIDILENIGLPFKSYSYPEYLLSSVNVMETYTYIQSMVYMNLTEIK